MSDASLKQQVQEDMKTAMRAKDKERLGVIRMLLAAIKQKEIDERITLDELQSLAVVEKMVKQRRDSVEQFTKGGREDLANTELAEIEILQHYLPKQLSEDEVTLLIDEAIKTTGASKMQDMGKVMAFIKPKAQGRADMGKISAKLKATLTA